MDKMNESGLCSFKQRQWSLVTLFHFSCNPEWGKKIQVKQWLLERKRLKNKRKSIFKYSHLEHSLRKWDDILCLKLFEVLDKTKSAVWYFQCILSGKYIYC